MIMSEYLNAMKQRRSIYALGKNVKQTPAELVKLIEEAIKLSPTAFNSQSVRAIITFGADSDKVWDITAAELRKLVKDDAVFAKTKEKLDSFKASFGTVLLFTDMDVVHGLEEQFPLYKDNFYDWSEQGMGGAQQAVWTALAEAGLGANLQHYNPVIDDQIKATFNVPANWRLRGQLNFGSVEQPAGDKDFMADDQRFKVFGA